jgi:hypothetical protein
MIMDRKYKGKWKMTKNNVDNLFIYPIILRLVTM